MSDKENQTPKEMTEGESSAVEFINSKATFDTKKDTFSVSRKEYYAYGAQRGVPQEMFQSVKDVDQDLGSAAIRVAADKLAVKVKDALKKGEDPKDLEFSGTIQTAIGKISARVMAERVRTVPKRVDKDGNVLSEQSTITKHGPSSLQVIVSKGAKKEPGLYAQDRIAAAMKGK
jgi:hypothetical protein